MSSSDPLQPLIDHLAARLPQIAVPAILGDLVANVRRLAEAAEEQRLELQRQGALIDELIALAMTPDNPQRWTGTRLQELEAKMVSDHIGLVDDLVGRIHTDPQLREALRGPRGLSGLDGERGPKGDDGATVIREVNISG